MSFSTGFRGSVNGSVQANYTDQPGRAVPGMLAFASDINLVDSYPVQEANGVAAGRGVVGTFLSYSGYDGSTIMQNPPIAINLPDVSSTPDDFFGVTVFDEGMQSDENGIPGYANGRMARVLADRRAGGRIWVDAVEAIDPTTATVNLVTEAGSDGLYEVGQFAPAALAGDATHGTSVALVNAKWVTKAAATTVTLKTFAMIELMG